MNLETTKPAMSPELKKRIGTGVLGAALLLALVIFGSWPGIYLITGALALGMIHEFSEICFTLPDKIEKRYALLLLTWIVVIVDLVAIRAGFEVLVGCFLALSVYFLVAADRHESPEDFSTHFKELMYSVFGILYVVLIPLYLPRIHELLYGVKWTILFLLIVWAGDTGAYFAGKKYGRRKLYPRVSPKKTIEGAIGGLLAGLVVTLLYKLIVFRALGWFGLLVIPIAVGIVAQAGDLVESLLKRAFFKKDSGSILPGHGGFLDRFDGVVFSLPVMYACIRLFG